MKEMPMLKSVQLIALFCIGLFFGTAQANVNLLGFDDMSCKAWVESKNDPDQRKLYVVWMRGFLTGYNYGEQAKQVSSISSGTVEQYANRYCASNPTGQFSDAVFRLSDEFSGRNQPLKK
jgi:hypothetical protein